MPYLLGLICFFVLSQVGHTQPIVTLVVSVLTIIVLGQRAKLKAFQINTNDQLAQIRSQLAINKAFSDAGNLGHVKPVEERVEKIIPEPKPADSENPIDLEREPTPQSPVINFAHPSIPAPKESIRIPAQPIAPRRSTFEAVESMFGTTVAHFLLRGNPIARIGVVILFFGVAFFLKYVSDAGYFPIELRLLGSAALALSFIALGWRLRAKRAQFAVTLQGAGAGIFYITVFIAFHLYHQIPGPLAFVFLVAITVVTASLSLIENARSLAFLSITGGFLAPALASSGGGSHIALFSYFALLNLGIFAMSWYRSWSEINLVGFVFTLVLSSLWGAKYYRPRFFYGVEPFLIFFVILYAVIAILIARRQRIGQSGVVETFFIFGTPIVGFALQTALVKGFEYGTAASAVGFGGVYIILTRFVYDRFGGQLRFLVESFFAIGVCFLTLAVPLAFDGRLTSAVWALEAVAIIWSGTRQKRSLMRSAGLLLLAFSSISFLCDPVFSKVNEIPFLNAWFYGAALLCAAHILTARILKSADDATLSPTERGLGDWSILVAFAWWFLAGLTEIARHTEYFLRVANQYFGSTSRPSVLFTLNIHVVFICLSGLLFFVVGRRLRLPQLEMVKDVASVIALALLLFLSVCNYEPLADFGIFIWPIVLLVHYTLLRVQDRQGAPVKELQHCIGLWLLVVLLAIESYWKMAVLMPESSSWAFAALSIVPAVSCAVVVWLRDETLWPFTGKRELYLNVALAPILLWIFCWPTFLDFFHAGSSAPLSYIALLNPLDIAQLTALLSIVYWLKRVSNPAPNWLPSMADGSVVIGIWAFIWINAILLRSIHHYFGVAWNIEALFDSGVVQAAISVFWSILSLLVTTVAHRQQWRGLWKAGAVLIGAVVLKLFVVDLSGQGTLARIGAFLGTGFIMLIIGYLAPIPPQRKEKSNDNS